jgi:hypothetical protein
MIEEKQPVEGQPVASESTGGDEPIRIEEFAEDPDKQPASEMPAEMTEPAAEEPGETLR